MDSKSYHERHRFLILVSNDAMDLNGVCDSINERILKKKLD